MFHLINHAFFKALLFLSSGAVIHAVADEQDMRKMGGLLKLLPFVHLCIFVGSLALAGAPFLSGFYSKDAILELAYGNFDAVFGYWFATLATFFTAFYSVRLLYYTFYAPPMSSRSVLNSVSEASWIMLIPFCILFLGSLFSGYMGRDLFIGLGTDFWGVSLLVLPSNVYFLESEFLPTYIKLIPTLFSLAGGIFAVFVYFISEGIFNFVMSYSFVRNFYIFFAKRWFFDIFYSERVAKPFLNFGYYVTFRYLDRGLIELVGPYGLARLSRFLSEKVSTVGSGYLYHYFMLSLIALLFLISNFVFAGFVFLWIDFSTVIFVFILLLYLFVAV
jgi:NADH-ubiquinone oxidoreductase chain 5